MKHLITLLFALALTTTTWSQGWNSVAEMPDNHRTNHAFGFALNDVGYMVSGQVDGGFSDAFYSYDAGTDTWTQLDDFPGPARGYTIGDTWDGKAWMGFGDSNSGMLNDLWMYDPETDEWTEKASCPCSARLHPAFVAIDDHIYVGLGNDNGGNTNDWWEYSMDTDSWEQMPDFPDLVRHHPFQFGVDGAVYVGMGHGADIYNTWYKFEPATESWTELANLPGEGRVAGTQNSYGSVGFVLSGDGEDHSSMETGENWQYDPALDLWTSFPVHPGMSRWAPSSFIINDEIYLINGMSMDPGSFDYMDTNWKFSLIPTNSNDAAVASYEGDSDFCGPDPVSIVARITNWGSEPLTSAQVNFVVDGTTELSTDWTGNLGTYSSANVILGDYNFDGSTDFDITITGGDDNADNDAISAAIVAAPSGSNVWRITINTDDWGNETGWRIEDESGTTIAQVGSGTYGNLNTYEEEVVLPEMGCFTFYLTDTFGDGLNGESSNGSNGSLLIESLDGSGTPETTLVNYDGSYGFFEAAYLAEVDAILSVEDQTLQMTSIAIFPNPTQDQLTVQWTAGATGGQVQIEVLNAVGAVVYSTQTSATAFNQNVVQLDASAWESGMYMVRLSSRNGSSTHAIVKQ